MSARTCGNCCERDSVGVWIRPDGAQVPVCDECGESLRAADRGDHGAKLRAQRAANGQGGAQSRTEDRLLITAAQDAVVARQDSRLTPALRSRKSDPLEGIMAKKTKSSGGNGAAKRAAETRGKSMDSGPAGLSPLSFPYVVAVRGNLGTGVACPLGPRTLVYGKNATGKSTLLRAVELALSGAVSDVAGRAIVSREADLMALAPGRTGTLFAEVQLSTGERIGYKCSDVAGAKRGEFTGPLPGVVDPARVFPLRAVREAIEGSADTSRRFFMQHAVGAVSVPEVVKRLPLPLQVEVERFGLGLSAVTAATGDGITALTAALEAVEDRLRESRSEARGADKIVNATGAGLAPEPTDAEITGAVEAARLAQQNLTAVAQAATFEADRIRREENVREGQMLWAERENVRAALKLAANAAVGLTSEDDVAARGLLAAVEWAQKRELDHCVCCNQPGAMARYDHTRAAIGKLLNSAPGIDAQRLTARDLELSNRISVLETLLRDLDGRLVQAAGAPSGLSLQGANEVLAAANAHVTVLRTLKAQHAQVRASRAEGLAAQQEVVTLTALRDALKLVARDLLDGSVEAFEWRVQRYLPVGDKFFLRLREGAREVCQFGLDGAGGLRTALSGAEWARVTIALAAAVSEGGSTLTILIPEDRAFDPETLHGVMTALSQAPYQVLIAQPIAPKALPAGWLAVNTDLDQHRACVAEWGTAPSAGPALAVVR